MQTKQTIVKLLTPERKPEQRVCFQRRKPIKIEKNFNNNEQGRVTLHGSQATCMWEPLLRSSDEEGQGGPLPAISPTLQGPGMAMVRRFYQIGIQAAILNPGKIGSLGARTMIITRMVVSSSLVNSGLHRMLCVP